MLDFRSYLKFLIRNLDMCLFRKYRRQDRIAREIAASHNMLDDYRAARRNGCSPIEALEEWDLLDEEARKKLNETEKT